MSRTSTPGARRGALPLAGLLVCSALSCVDRAGTSSANAAAPLVLVVPDAGDAPEDTVLRESPNATLVAAVERTLGLVNAALSRCHDEPAAMARLRQWQAGAMADRDEIAMRERRNDWRDRDVDAWIRKHRRLHGEIASVTC